MANGRPSSLSHSHGPAFDLAIKKKVNMGFLFAPAYLPKLGMSCCLDFVAPSSSTTPPKADAVREFCVFMALGTGTQWIINDALQQCLGVFMADLPGGIELPNIASSLVGGCGSLFAILLWWAFMKFSSRRLTDSTYRRCSWINVWTGPLTAVGTAIAWRAVVGDVPIVVHLAFFISNVQGQLTYNVQVTPRLQCLWRFPDPGMAAEDLCCCALTWDLRACSQLGICRSMLRSRTRLRLQVPMLSLHYSERALSGVMTGSGIGSMLSGGVLGLIQTSVPSFGPTALMWTVAVFSFISVRPLSLSNLSQTLS